MTTSSLAAGALAPGTCRWLPGKPNARVRAQATAVSAAGSSTMARSRAAGRRAVHRNQPPMPASRSATGRTATCSIHGIFSARLSRVKIENSEARRGSDSASLPAIDSKMRC